MNTNTDNDTNEVYDEPSVPQYQIQLENLDFEVKKLKGNLFILEQEHTREIIRINSKLDSAKRALEKPLKDLEKAKNNDYNAKDEEVNKINEEVNKIVKKRRELEDKIKNEEKILEEKQNEENIKYERMSMLENDIGSTNYEKKKMEKELPLLDKKTELIANTYPQSFKKLTDDFILFDKKSRIEVNIKEIEDEIILQTYKVKEYQDIKSSYDNITEEKEGNADDIELKLKLNSEKQNDIDNLMKELAQNVNQIVLIEKYFHMFDELFKKKNYINNQIDEKIAKDVIIPFINELLENYTEMNNNQLDLVDVLEKEIEDLNDIKPATMQIKREIKLKQNKLKEEKTFSEYLQNLLKICQNLKEEWGEDLNSKNKSIATKELNFFENLKKMISSSAETSKEEVEKLFDDYLELKEEKEREYFYLMGGSKEANAEFDDIKNQAKSFNDIVIRHQNQIEKLTKEKKNLQDELKALNDTINLKSKEFKTTLSNYSEEEFSEYFNLNKELLKLLLFKEKKPIVKNNQYELTKDNIYENVLVDHSRKKTNMYVFLKRKYLLQYLINLYTEDNLDVKHMNERTKKAYNELIKEINNIFTKINSFKEEINTLNKEISEKQEKANDANYAGNTSVDKLNSKVQMLTSNIEALENEKIREQNEYENKKYNLESQINLLLQEIEELEEQLNNKLNRMTDGNINLYLKYDDNTKNYNPIKDNKFIPNKFGYSLREFCFDSQNQMLFIKDTRNNIIEKKIKYEMIKRISLDVDSYKLVEEIEKKFYNDERERNKDPKCKKKIKFFIVLRRSNLDLVAKEYNDYKKIADIVNSIIIHK